MKNLYQKIYLNEVKVFGSSTQKLEGQYWAYRDGTLFIFSEDELNQVYIYNEDEGSESLVVPESFREDYDSMGIEIFTDENVAIDYRILTGRILKDVLFVNIPTEYNSRPKNMLSLKKICRTLGLEKVSFSNQDGVFRIEKSPSKDLPDVFYHGTSSKFIPEIFKSGIAPIPKSNFHVKHSDKIFLSSSMEYVRFYAANASEKQGGFPVVLEISGIDPDLVVPDFDVYLKGGRKDWEIEDEYEKQIDWKYKQKNFQSSATRRSKDWGIFAYRGKILPQKIKRIFYLVGWEREDLETFYLEPGDYEERISKEDLLKAIENWNELEDIMDERELREGVFNHGIDWLEDVISELRENEEEYEDEEYEEE